MSIEGIRQFAEAGREELNFAKLFGLRQHGTVIAYAMEYQNLVSQLSSYQFSPETCLQMFLYGLREPVQSHVRMQKPVDVEQSIEYAIIADHFTPDWDRNYYNHDQYKNDQQHQGYPNNYSRPQEHPRAMDRNGNIMINNLPLKPLSPEDREVFRSEGRCFRCRQLGHISRSCPRNNSETAQSLY